MANFMGVNTTHLDYLRPLMKWKIMDIKSLLKLSNCPSTYYSFARIIRNLQSVGVLESAFDPVTRKKYVCFSNEGIKLISGSPKLSMSKEDSPDHDARASEIVRKFLEHGYIEKVFLEHEFYSKDSIIPDASLYGAKNGKNFSIAFEFELTRKSKPRVIGKMKSYFSSTDFDYVMYFFTSKSLMLSYEKFIREELGDKYLDRIMFVSHPAIMWEEFPFPQSTVLFKGENKSLGELFQ